MIQSAKYNGINFSGDFNRSSEKYNYSLQRKKGVIIRKNFSYLSFLCDYSADIDTAKLYIISKNGEVEVNHNSLQMIDSDTKIIFYFAFTASNFTTGLDVRFKFDYNGSFIYSEFYEVVDSESEICHIVASNADDRHGYLTNSAFGFFRFSEIKMDFFVNKKTEYEYSYGRKKILSSENQISKRFTFADLTMYQANLLKWLCNCESLTINSVQYQIISDFTELESDPNNEILNIQADFVEVEQSFFATGATEAPLNIFTNEFFL